MAIERGEREERFSIERGNAVPSGEEREKPISEMTSKEILAETEEIRRRLSKEAQQTLAEFEKDAYDLFMRDTSDRAPSPEAVVLAKARELLAGKGTEEGTGEEEKERV